MLKKSAFFLCLLYFIFCMPNIICAAEFENYPEKNIELITNTQKTTASFKKEQGENIIILSDISSSDILKITFQARNYEIESYMINNLVIEYKISTIPFGKWKKWINLAQPLKINFDEYLKNNHQRSDEVIIKIRFLVPQSIKIRRGSYPGDIYLELLN